MISVIGFLVVLAPLVIVHEFGHFLMAKLFNVKAEAFSVGFGPVIFQRKFGETDFRASIIPLGGYVKLLGEDPTREMTDEEKKRALHTQAPWKRFFIFFGGPLFNFLWAALVFMVMMLIGEPQVSSVIGRVVPDSPAAVAGLVAGDQVISVGGKPVRKFEELVQEVSDRPNSSVPLEVLRDSKTVVLSVHTDSEDGYSIYGEEKRVGAIDGIFANSRNTRLGISDPASVAAKAGLKTGDEITAINGTAVKSWEEIEKIEPQLSTNPVELKIHSADNTDRTVSFALPKKGVADRLAAVGIHSIELFVEKVVSGSPAEHSGMHAGDRLISVQGVAVQSFLDLKINIQKNGEAQGLVKIDFEREGKIQEISIVPTGTTERDPSLKKRTQFTVGIMPFQSLNEPVTFIERVTNPFTLVWRGFDRMFELSARNFISFGKMLTGQVSVKGLGGPISIGKLAGDSLTRGWIEFLRMMALLSVGLGVLNVLPVPVLDGGHILLLVIEVIRGRSLSMRQLEMVQRVGLAMIMLLMMIAMRNDLSRLPIFN